MTTENVVEKKTNPLLEKVSIPGERFKLPSGGVFYNDNEIDDSVKGGEIYVKPMTAVDELVLKSADKLLSGEAVTEVFEKCLPEVIKPEELLAKDVDFLLMCLRMISYGPTVEVTARHDCEDAKEHQYTMEIRPLLQKAKPIDPTKLKQFEMTLDSGQVIVLNPPRYRSTIKLYQTFGMGDNEELTSEQLSEQLLDTIGDMIASVDGHDDGDDIKEWLKAIRVGDVNQISDKIAELSDWGIDPEVEVKCKDCGEMYRVLVPINPISFFT